MYVIIALRISLLVLALMIFVFSWILPLIVRMSEDQQYYDMFLH